MNKKTRFKVTYRFMCLLAIIVGGVGILFQFLPGFEFFTFFLGVSTAGGLIGGSSGYEEQERQQLRQSYKTAFEALLLVIMFAYAFMEVLKWLAPANKALAFLNGHWSGLIIAVMCALLGIAGLRRESRQIST